LRGYLQNPSFSSQHTTDRIVRGKDLQPFFEPYIKRAAITKRRVNGKVVLFMPLLRYPASMFESYLDPEQTIRVTYPKDKEDNPLNFRFESYIQAGDPYLPELLRKAEGLLARYEAHPVFGHPFFKEKFLSDIRYAVGIINGVCRLFETQPVAAVLLGATNEAAGRALAIMASRRRIPSIVMQHGVIGREEGFLPVYASRLAVHGYHEQEWYEGKGVSKKLVHVAGHPRFDIFTTKQTKPRAEVLALAGVDPGKKTVLVVTNQIRDIAAWKSYIEELMKYPDVNVLIKPHRNEIKTDSLGDYIALSKRYSRVKLIVDNEIKMNDLLQSMDAVAVELTTVGLEAMLCGVPVLCLRKTDYSAMNHNYYYERMGEFVGTDSVHIAKKTYAVLRSTDTRNRNLAQIKAFLRHAYPVSLGGEALSRLISRLTGKVIRRPAARQYEGRLIKGSAPEIYYVRHGVKRHILSQEALASHGFSTKAVRRVDDAVLKQIPPGQLIR